MKTHDLVQGSPEWSAHRATHFNASDAPAMMGVSPYKTRSQLLHELHTGLSPEVDPMTQRRFDDGHRVEALARPLAEEFIGEDLYPVVGSDGELSASFDGLTMSEEEGLEHKALNDVLRAVMVEDCTGADLPQMYQIQMEQQLAVCKGKRILFMASKWDGDTLVEERHCWYYPNLELRQQIIAGWAQFAKDLAAYVPTEVKELPKAQVVVELPALFVHARGEITTHNMVEFGEALKAKLAEVRSIVLANDQDFSNAKESAKMFRNKAKEIALSKDAMLSQTVTIGEAARMMDAWSEDLNKTALQLEKDVEKADLAKKAAMISEATLAYSDHVTALNNEISPITLLVQRPSFTEVIKGKRNYTSMQDAVSTALATGKAEADSQAKELRVKLAWLKVSGEGFDFLFSDLATIIRKPSDDFQLMVTTRITAHKAAEAAKEAALVARIEAEAKEKAEREARAKVEAEQAAAAKLAREQAAFEQLERDETARLAKLNTTMIVEAAPVVSAPAPVVLSDKADADRNANAFIDRIEQQMPAIFVPDPVRVVKRPAPTLSLGEISTRLGFNVTSVFLASLGYEAITVRAAKLFHEEDFPAICRALIEHIESVCELQPA